jgi:hypothetical protein
MTGNEILSSMDESASMDKTSAGMDGSAVEQESASMGKSAAAAIGNNEV